MTVAILFACASGWLTILCLSLYAHRAMAHRSLTLHPAVAHFMRFWLWLTTGASTRAWVAVHRKHHAFVDREEDPHSPVVHGLLKILFFGYWYYRRETLNAETIEKYGKDCPNDWLERNVYVRLHLVGLGLLLLFNVLVFGIVPGLVAFGIQILWEEIWAAGVINGLGHAVGYRDFDTRDASRNIVPWGLIVSGEELHNNHHRWPRSARFSARWWEIDIGWGVIRVLSALGLARDLYVFDRRLDQHRIDRAESRMQALFASWRARMSALAQDQRQSFAEKRREIERMWNRFSRKLERRLSRLDQEGRKKLAQLRDDLLQQMRALLGQLLEGGESA
jgi:stearoyl-CoA desaturase (delta-9 desaturase)